MDIALAAPLVFAAQFQLAVGPLLWPGGVGGGVTGGNFGGDLVETDAPEAAHGAGEVFVDQLPAKADRLEDLGAGVAGDRADTHLAHHLQHTLAGGLDVVLQGVVGIDGAEAVDVVGDHVLDALERQVRVDRAGAVADEQGHVVHLTGIAALHNEADLGALLLANEVVVDGRCQQEAGDRRVDLVAVAVAEHDDAHALVDRLAHLVADGVERPRQRQSPTGYPVQATHHVGGELGIGPLLAWLGIVDVDDLAQLVVVEHREGQHQLAAALRARSEKVRLRAHRAADAGDHLFADRIEGWVRDLGEELLEVVEQEARPLAEHGDGCVGAHRTDRLGAGARHRGEDDLQFLVGVAEDLLATQHALVTEDDVLAVW